MSSYLQILKISKDLELFVCVYTHPEVKRKLQMSQNFIKN